ncbi:MAG: ABC transporter permease [Treponema sp.]
MKKLNCDAKIAAGAGIVAALFLCMAAGLFYLPYAPNEVSVAEKLSFFSRAHICGTDNLGRDVASRLLVSLRISFLIGFTSASFGFVSGTALGAFGGFLGGKTDAVITKLIDVQMSFPGILLALMLVAALGPGLKTTIFALCIMTVPRFARIARSGFIKYRNSALTLGEKARGASTLRIMFVHIFPNILGDLLVTYSLSFASAIMNESGLSYLGLGVQPPAASFGKMLSDAQSSVFQAPWIILVPAGTLALLIIGFTLISDGITSLMEGR